MPQLTPKFKCQNINGHLTVVDSKEFSSYLKSLGKEVELTVKPYVSKKSNRSINQNSYYWGVVVDILSGETGHTAYEIHEILKFKFLSDPLDLVTSKGKLSLTIPKSTSSLTTIEMEEFLSEIREWASADLGVYIPVPHEVVY